MSTETNGNRLTHELEVSVGLLRSQCVTGLTEVTTLIPHLRMLYNVSCVSVSVVKRFPDPYKIWIRLFLQYWYNIVRLSDICTLNLLAKYNIMLLVEPKHSISKQIIINVTVYVIFRNYKVIPINLYNLIIIN